MTKKVLLYIHGFNSSPSSFKALRTVKYINANHEHVECIVPQMPSSPYAAVTLLKSLVAEYKDNLIGIIGSSLGGYMATFIVETLKPNVKAVLVNPAVKPYELIHDFLGEQVNPYTKEKYEVTLEHIEDLKLIDTPHLKFPTQYWLLQQEGDEVLDYRQAVGKYKDCKQTVEPDGEHAFLGFERFLPDIVKFLEIA